MHMYQQQPQYRNAGNNPYNDGSESSPMMSKTDQPSGYIDGDSSLQESPMSPDQPDLLHNLNVKAQQINDHLARMKQQDSDESPDRPSRQEVSETLSPLADSEL